MNATSVSDTYHHSIIQVISQTEQVISIIFKLSWLTLHSEVLFA